MCLFNPSVIWLNLNHPGGIHLVIILTVVVNLEDVFADCFTETLKSFPSIT